MNSNFKNTIRLLTQDERKHFFLLTITDAVICVLDILSLAALVFLINFYLHPGKLPSGFFDTLFTDSHSVLPAGVFFLLFSLKNWAAYQLNKKQYQFV
ncbi:MAG: hypothetical protein WCI49_16030 [Ferruginibacter sp.]